MLMAIQGTLVGSIVTLVLLACFSKSLKGGNYAQLDAVWRLQMGLALIPALLTLWPRLKMPEGKKYLESRELTKPKRPDSVESRFTATTHRTRHRDSLELIVSDGRGLQEEIDAARAEVEAQGRRASLDVFLVYFREWRHLKTLIGTMSCWFLLDVAFYGVNLNQSVLLMEIGYAKGANEFSVLKKTAIGNLIIAVAGYIPGYFFTIYFIEKLGRKWIQIQGFLVVALMFAIIAGDYEYMGTGGKFVCLAIAQVPRPPSPTSLPDLVLANVSSPQFFFNFGPNTTTFIIPAEVFPTRVRGFGHGVSAAAGKVGAILSTLLFNYLSGPTVIGFSNVLWIFFVCSILGALSTYFLIPETKWKDADVLDYEEWFDANITEMNRS